ncbi:hypothetical protein [Sinomonas terrae]|uniref:Uncharacterized protein n=1 Tax=Sinomonas terrae TaxID=2908838 RepID=A0ABS9U4G7_9MICC|nr:hypothetical protein [Sinomonas terrae]MCH6471545.1 hypothetical protein [Sinomonas terrae]
MGTGSGTTGGLARPECRIYILPFVMRKVDPTYHISNLRWKIYMARRYGWHHLLRR